MDVTTIPAPIAGVPVDQKLVDAATSHPVSCACPTCMAVIDAASEHRYDCACSACYFWWTRMPAEDEDEA